MKSAPRAQLTPLKDQFSTLYSTYVMDEQRDVHQRALGAQATPRAARTSKVELF